MAEEVGRADLALMFRKEPHERTAAERAKVAKFRAWERADLRESTAVRLDAALGSSRTTGAELRASVNRRLAALEAKPPRWYRHATSEMRRGVAVHEAGHAVAALRLGARFSTVTILGDREDLCLGALALRNFDSLTAHDRALVYLAGPAAEDVIQNTQDHRRVSGDWTQARRWLAVYDANTPLDVLESRLGRCWYQDAKDLVKDNSRALSAIADALLQHDTLSEADCRALVNWRL
ncbi:MAG: hypothetical protein HS116_05210 [Planctomycetes bacterium]|nr:hypothetical protein [Planctomycetota bacterium]